MFSIIFFYFWNNFDNLYYSNIILINYNSTLWFQFYFLSVLRQHNVILFHYFWWTSCWKTFWRNCLQFFVPNYGFKNIIWSNDADYKEQSKLWSNLVYNILQQLHDQMKNLLLIEKYLLVTWWWSYSYWSWF